MSAVPSQLFPFPIYSHQPHTDLLEPDSCKIHLHHLGVTLFELRLNILNPLPVYWFSIAIMSALNILRIPSPTYSPDTCINCLHSIQSTKYLFPFQFTLVIFWMIFLALCPKFIFSPTYLYHIYTIYHLYFFHIPISHWVPVTHL